LKALVVSSSIDRRDSTRVAESVDLAHAAGLVHVASPLGYSSAQQPSAIQSPVLGRRSPLEV